MLKNVGRKVSLIAALLALSIGFLTLKEKPFNLGLDLQGGTRLVYSVDFDQAYEDGLIDASESRDLVISQTIEIIRNRIDPDGTLEAIIRRGDQSRIIIELPGTLGTPKVSASSTLATAISEVTSDELVLGDAEQAKAFPESGVVRVGDEKIRYDGKRGNALLIAPAGRQQSGTVLAAHTAGSAVDLQSDDAFRAAIESLGELSFQILVDSSNVPAGTDLQSERERLDTWAEANPNTPIAAFNRLAPPEGPHAEIEWVPHAFTAEEGAEVVAVPEAERAAPLFRPASPEEEFRGSALSRVYPTRDELGRPAVGFEIQPSRRSEFGEFTETNQGRYMAIVLNGEIYSAPILESRISQGGRIAGRFSDAEVRDLMTVLRSGSLKIKPKLEDDERVTATLGEDYVKRGEYSGLLAVVVVLAFIALYYRRLGVYATVSMALSFVMLMGALSFGNATITLPGIAGIILTIGMAVDANILIFDRIREEMDKGRNLKQAAKEGFNRAMPAILDANITTFLTALILRNVGSGPVRGFAVTLMWGILTSVFAALVITRVLVHFSLERGAKSFPMGQWMVKAKFDFASKFKLALTASSMVIALGLGLFAITEESKKFGIDFLGGAEAQLRTAEPQTVDTVRAAIGAIEGPIGKSADVKAVLSSATEGELFTRFRTTFKTVDDSGETLDGADIQAQLRENLSGLLLEESIQVSTTDGEADTQVQLALLFDQGHPPDDIATRMAEAGLQDASVTSDAPARYTATATTAFGRTPAEITAALQRAFNGNQDSSGIDYRLAQGIPTYSQVGPQVVGELRDKALLALAIVSLFVDGACTSACASRSTATASPPWPPCCTTCS